MSGITTSTPMQVDLADINAKNAEPEHHLQMRDARLNYVSKTQVNDPDSVNDVGYYLRHLQELPSTINPSQMLFNAFDSVSMKRSELNLVGRSQINIGAQVLSHAPLPGEDDEIKGCSQRKGVVELVESDANVVGDQINVGRPTNNPTPAH